MWHKMSVIRDKINLKKIDLRKSCEDLENNIANVLYFNSNQLLRVHKTFEK